MQVAYGSDPAKTQVVDLAKYIDRENKRVRSITGQIETDYGKGVYRVDSPLAQAAAGFLKDAGPQHLADVDIICRNNYATDRRRALGRQADPGVRKSARFRSARYAVLWAGSRCPPARESTASRATASASFPGAKSQLQVENTDVTVSVANPRITKAVLLDINGMATQTPVELKQSGGKATVVLPANSMYVVLQ